MKWNIPEWVGVVLVKGFSGGVIEIHPAAVWRSTGEA